MVRGGVGVALLCLPGHEPRMSSAPEGALRRHWATWVINVSRAIGGALFHSLGRVIWATGASAAQPAPD